MTEDILQAIKKKAEEIYFLFDEEMFDDSFRTYGEYKREQESLRRAYTSGCIEGIGIAIGFANWKENSGYIKSVTHPGKILWFHGLDGKYEKTYYTTEQLLSLYIKQLNNG